MSVLVSVTGEKMIRFLAATILFTAVTGCTLNTPSYEEVKREPEMLEEDYFHKKYLATLDTPDKNSTNTKSNATDVRPGWEKVYYFEDPWYRPIDFLWSWMWPSSPPTRILVSRWRKKHVHTHSHCGKDWPEVTASIMNNWRKRMRERMEKDKKKEEEKETQGRE